MLYKNKYRRRLSQNHKNKVYMVSGLNRFLTILFSLSLQSDLRLNLNIFKIQIWVNLWVIL